VRPLKANTTRRIEHSQPTLTACSNTNLDLYPVVPILRNISFKLQHTRSLVLRDDASLSADIPVFHCFCHEAFYISNFKDFNTQAPACF
jgi:hypothetical protein